MLAQPRFSLLNTKLLQGITQVGKWVFFSLRSWLAFSLIAGTRAGFTNTLSHHVSLHG
jgi:hypothetical protein